MSYTSKSTPEVIPLIINPVLRQAPYGLRVFGIAMNILQTSLFAIVIGYCLLSAAGLRNLLPQWRLRYFSVFLLLEAVGFGFEWLMLNPESGFKSLWLGGLMQLSLLIAPCLWLCTAEITQQQTPNPFTLPRLHKWLLVVASLCLLPLLFSAHGGTGFGNPVKPMSAYQAIFIHGTMLICIAIFTLQVPMLVMRIRLLLQEYEQRIAANFSNLHEHSLQALNWLLLILLVKWLMAILRTLHCMYIGPLGGVGINLFMTIEIIFTLRALFALSRLKPAAELQSDYAATPEKITLATTEKYANSALDDAARQRILKKLQEVMQTRQRYKQASLSLRQLSEELRESSHYLSQVINQDLHTSFYEWVNHYRIEAAKQMLLKHPDHTILAIAEEVGFNSKSTFNTAFRQYTQMTPSEYRRQNPAIPTDWFGPIRPDAISIAIPYLRSSLITLEMDYPGLFSSVYAMHPFGTATGETLMHSRPDWKQMNLARDWKDLESNIYSRVFMLMAQAYLPNPNKPPFYADLMVELQGEKLVVNANNVARLQQDFLLDARLPVRANNLRQLTGFKMD